MTRKALTESELEKEDIIDSLSTLGYKVTPDESEQPVAVSNRSS